VITIALLVLLVAFAGVTTWFLIWRGFDKDLADAPLSKQPRIARWVFRTRLNPDRTKC